jgi:hypothetical protein
MPALLLRYPTSLGTSLSSPPVAVNSPPAPDAGVADVAAMGGITVTGSAMTSAKAEVDCTRSAEGGHPMNQTPPPDEPTAQLATPAPGPHRRAWPRRTVTLLLAAAAAVVLLVIGGVVGYLLGHQGATTQAANVGSAAQGSKAGAFGPGGFHGHGRGGRGAAGTIDSVNGSTITLTTRNGRKVTVTAAPDVAVTVRSEGTVADLKQGQSIVVSGRVGSDGTITANRINVGPGPR